MGSIIIVAEEAILFNTEIKNNNFDNQSFFAKTDFLLFITRILHPVTH